MDEIRADAESIRRARPATRLFVDGYFVKGHVPAHAVARLLSGRSDAIGLAAPVIAVGSARR